jgi:hypothetical protein
VSPRVRGFRSLLLGLALGGTVALAISPPVLPLYGSLQSSLAIHAIAGVLTGILIVAVPLVLQGLVSVITGKTLKASSEDWDRLKGYQRGVLGCAIVAIVVFLIYKVGSFWASLP